MGDPRRFKNKFSRPAHPWQRARIEEERFIVREYGLKTKRELWKAQSRLKVFADQAKRLTALRSAQAQHETKLLLTRLNRLGLLSATATLDDVLGLNVKNLLDRRLQTVVFKKNLARTHRQARQFIVHEHVLVGEKQINSPSYLVPVSDENKISIISTSSLASAEHPERALKPRPVAAIAREVVKDDRRGFKHHAKKRVERKPEHKAKSDGKGVSDKK